MLQLETGFTIENGHRFVFKAEADDRGCHDHVDERIQTEVYCNEEGVRFAVYAVGIFWQ